MRYLRTEKLRSFHLRVRVRVRVEDISAKTRAMGGSISASHDIYTGTVKILPEL